MTTEFSMLPLIMVGAGGHAKVLFELARLTNQRVIGVVDPQLTKLGHPQWMGVPVLGGDGALEGIDAATVGLINGVGQLVASKKRQELYLRLKKVGFRFPVMIHPTAWVASSVELALGVQVMAGAIVQPDCRIGENSILNTRVSVDHDCEIGANVHIAPGAVLCGGVRVHDGAFIAAGATVIPGLTVGREAVVGAGVTLVADLPAGQVLLGPKPCSR